MPDDDRALIMYRWAMSVGVCGFPSVSKIPSSSPFPPLPLPQDT
jgi:hypothetical protein